TPFYRLPKPLGRATVVLTLLTHGCPLQALVAAYGLDERTLTDWQAKAGTHVEVFPTAHRGGFVVRERQRIVEGSSFGSASGSWRVLRSAPQADRGARVAELPGLRAAAPLPDLRARLERPPRATASRRPAEGTSCTTNSRRGSAPSVSASPADPSRTSVRLWVA